MLLRYILDMLRIQYMQASENTSSLLTESSCSLPERMVYAEQRTNGVGQTDAAEISADKPTVLPVTGHICVKLYLGSGP